MNSNNRAQRKFVAERHRPRDFDSAICSMSAALYNAGYAIPLAILQRDGYASADELRATATFITWKISLQARREAK